LLIVESDELEMLFSSRNENEFLAFGRNDELLAERDTKNNIIIHEVDKKTPSRTLAGHEAEIIAAEFNSDGELLISSSLDYVIYVWEVFSGTIFKKLFCKSTMTPNGFCFPDLDTCLVLDSSQYISKWRIKEDEMVIKDRILNNGTDFFETAKISFDRKYLVALLQYETALGVYDLTSNQLLKKIALQTESKKALFSMSEKKLEVIVSCYDSKLMVYEIPSLQLKVLLDISALPGLRDFKLRQANLVSNNDRDIIVFSCSNDKLCKLVVVDQASKSMMKVKDFNDGGLVYLAANPNGKSLLVFTKNEIQVREAMNLGVEIVIKVAEPFHTEVPITFASNMGLFAIVDSKQTIRVYNQESGNEVISYVNQLTTVKAIAFTPDEKSIIFNREEEIVKKNMIGFGEYIKLRGFAQVLRKLEVPEEAINKFSTQEFSYYMNLASVYPYNVNILNFLSRTNDLESLSKLYDICEIFNIYPQLSVDAEGKSAINVAIERKNISALEVLIQFFLVSSHKLHCCPSLNLEALKSLFALGVPKAHQVFDARYLEPYGEIPMIPTDVGDIVTSAFESGYLSREQYLSVFNITEEDIEFSSSRLTYPEFRILDFNGILDPGNGFMEQISNLELNNPIFKSPALQAMIEFKWVRYAQKAFFLEGIWNLLYMVIYTVITIFLAPCRFYREFDTKEWDEWGYCSKSMLVLSLVLLGLILIIIVREGHQIRALGFRHYTRSLWNVVDLIIVLSSLVTVFLAIAELYSFIDDKESMKALYSASTFIVWGRLLDLFRGFRGTSFLIKIMGQTLLDIKFFIVIMFMLLVAFSFTGT
jgi:WD40 repeat protein